MDLRTRPVPGSPGIPVLRYLRSIVLVAGSLVFLLTLVFLFRTVQQNWSSLVGRDFGQLDVRWIALSGLAYALSVLTTMFVWPSILKALETPLPLSLGVAIGLTAQTGKYLPGNVAQHFGRAALAARHSISLVDSGISTIVELGSAVLGGILFVLFCILIDPDLFGVLTDTVEPSTLQRSILLTLVAAITVLLAGHRITRSSYRSWLILLRVWSPPVVAMVFSFALAGLSFFAMIRGIAGPVDPGYITAAVIFAVAWLAGFLVPGAPAGLGVRETIIIAFLTGVIGPASAIYCALLHRVMSAVMDGVMALPGVFFLLKEGRSHAN